MYIIANYSLQCPGMQDECTVSSAGVTFWQWAHVVVLLEAGQRAHASLSFIAVTVRNASELEHDKR